MKFVVPILLVIFVASNAFADEQRDAEGAFMLCVRKAAIRFEPSGETPQSIAKAAVWACLDEEARATTAILNSANPGIDPKSLQLTAEMVAIGQVVGVRLCKANKDCAYANAP